VSFVTSGNGDEVQPALSADSSGGSKTPLLPNQDEIIHRGHYKRV
jgi:hypothetical protein